MPPYLSVYMWQRTVQQTVGELATHTHSAAANNTGAHTHTFGYPRGDSNYQNGNGNQWWGPNNTATKTTNSAGNHTHTITVNNAGDNAAHLNMQPYITCYIWQRTAQAVLRQIYTVKYGCILLWAVLLPALEILTEWVCAPADCVTCLLL